MKTLQDYIDKLNKLNFKENVTITDFLSGHGTRQMKNSKLYSQSLMLFVS